VYNHFMDKKELKDALFELIDDDEEIQCLITGKVSEKLMQAMATQNTPMCLLAKKGLEELDE